MCIAPTEQTTPANNTSAPLAGHIKSAMHSSGIPTDPTKSAGSSGALPASLTGFDPSSSLLPRALMDLAAAAGCSKPVKVIETTDSTLYVALSNDRGGAPAGDHRSAPEIWADGEFIPTIYAIAKSKVVFVEYNLQNSIRVPPRTAATPPPIAATPPPPTAATPQPPSR